MSMLSPSASNVNISTTTPYMQTPPSNTLSYDPSMIAPTQQSMLGGINALGAYNTAAQALPQAWNIGQGMISDPNAQFAQSGANAAAAMGIGAAGNMYNYGGNILNTAMDPQMALYNQMQSQTTDAARANAAAAGLATSPAGVAGVDWSNNNFNIAWQNAQLQRQIQGGQAGTAMQAGASPLFYQSAMYPYQTSQGIGQQNLGTLNTLGNMGIQASQIPGQQIAGWQQSLGTMGALQGQANQQQQQTFSDVTNQQQQQFMDQQAIQQQMLAQNQQAFNQQQAEMQGFGKILGGIGGAALGGMVGGPAGMMAGGSLGSSIFGGGGGTTGPGWGYPSTPSPWASMPTSWNTPPSGGSYSTVPMM